MFFFLINQFYSKAFVIGCLLGDKQIMDLKCFYCVKLSFITRFMETENQLKLCFKQQIQIEDYVSAYNECKMI
jgi:hypothetical protein